MERFAQAILAVYEFMHIRWHLGKFNISFWEIVMYTIVVYAIWHFVYKVTDND